MRLIPIKDRFFAKVNPAGPWPKDRRLGRCWSWLGKINQRYGHLWIGYLSGAHRVSWMLHFGQIPVGLCVLHTCDNPICVNPNHLFVGTQADNNRDMWAKGRAPFGVKCHFAKLRPEQVLEIRAAAGFGIKPCAISSSGKVGGAYE